MASRSPGSPFSSPSRGASRCIGTPASGPALNGLIHSAPAECSVRLLRLLRVPSSWRPWPGKPGRAACGGSIHLDLQAIGRRDHVGFRRDRRLLNGPGERPQLRAAPPAVLGHAQERRPRRTRWQAQWHQHTPGSPLRWCGSCARQPEPIHPPPQSDRATVSRRWRGRNGDSTRSTRLGESALSTGPRAEGLSPP